MTLNRHPAMTQLDDSYLISYYCFTYINHDNVCIMLFRLQHSPMLVRNFISLIFHAALSLRYWA